MDGSAERGGGRMHKTIAELWDTFGWPVMLGCLGASVQCLKGPWKGWKNFLISNLSAAFSVIVCMSILPHYMPFDVAAGISGIVGYSGGTLIDAVLDRARREIETRDVPPK